VCKKRNNNDTTSKEKNKVKEALKNTAINKMAAATRELRWRVPAAHAKAFCVVCLFLLLQMGRHPFPMLLAEPSFVILSALATLFL